MSDEPSILRAKIWLTALGLMLMAWVIYSPSLRSGFVNFDDVRILRDHPELYGQKTLVEDFHSIFVTGFPREEPLLLRDVSWALDSRMFGFGNAFGYHLGNVLLHGVVVALMFVFLLGMTRRYVFALAVSVTFLALAIHTEPVAWIMGRKDILSALFMLLALIAQTRRLRTGGWRAGGWYLLTLVCFGAGLLSKISVLTFPLVLFLHAVLLPYLAGERPAGGAFRWDRKCGVEIFLLVPALIMSVLVYGWYRRTLTQMGIFDRGYTAHGLKHLWNLLVIDPMVLWTYLRQIFFPGQLRVLYTWPGVMTAYPLWQMAVSLGTVVAMVAAGAWLFLRRKDLFFYFGSFFTLMLPYLNLMYIGIWVAERYLYFSVFCVLALALSLAVDFLRNAQPVARLGMFALGAGFVAINVFQAFAYQPAWRNGESLWQYHVALPRNSPMAYENLAAGYYADVVARAGTTDSAVLLHKMEVVVDTGLAQFWPDHRQPPPPETYFLFFLRSIVQEVKGEPTAALESLRMSDRLRPDFDSTNLNLARLYHKLATATADVRLRQEYAQAARGRFEHYIALTYRQRPAPPEVQKELAELTVAAPEKDGR